MFAFAVFLFILVSPAAVRAEYLEEVAEYGTVTCDFKSNIYGHTQEKLLACEVKTQRLVHRGTKIVSARDEIVEALDFGHNKNIFLLPVNAAEVFPNLKEYSAAYCSLKAVSKINFANLRRLVALNLERNDLLTIADDTFADLESLEFLSLIQNRIIAMNATSVAPLNLKLLVMDKNECINESIHHVNSRFLIKLDKLCGGPNREEEAELTGEASKLKWVQHKFDVCDTESKFFIERFHKVERANRQLQTKYDHLVAMRNVTEDKVV